MIGFFCATPYHIIASATIASGVYADQDAILVILNHFDIDEGMVGRIRKSGLFKEVILYRSNNKNKINKVKRLVHTFIPDKTMYHLAFETKCSNWFFFALDFINLTFIMQAYKKRCIDCEFAYGDDGIGAYINPNCYLPKNFVVNLLRIAGRYDYLTLVKKLYVYKPEYMVENTRFDLIKILQTEEGFRKVQRLVRDIWPMEDSVQVNASILYFEQPRESEETLENVRIEQKCLDTASRILRATPIIKMHPRSQEETLWNRYTILKTKMPFEAMLLQNQCAPVLMMSNNSTAMCSMYLLDNLDAKPCPSVFLGYLLPSQNQGMVSSMLKFCDIINSNSTRGYLCMPSSEDALFSLLTEFSENI